MDISNQQHLSVPLRGRRPRLTIVEQYAAFADALEGSLWGSYRVRQVIVSDTSTTAGVVSTVRSSRPELALVTSRLGPFLDVDAVIDGLVSCGVEVVALCPSGPDQDPATWSRCRRAGAAGVLSLDCDLATLQETLRRTDRSTPRGRRSRPAGHLTTSGADDPVWSARTRLASLTPREREIVTQLMGGRCVAEIARAAVVSEATVRTQIKSILAKLDVRSQLAAVALARGAGWTVPADHWLSVAS